MRVLIAMIAELKIDVLGDNGFEEASVAELIRQRKICKKASMNFTINGQDERTVVTWRENS